MNATIGRHRRPKQIMNMHQFHCIYATTFLSMYTAFLAYSSLLLHLPWTPFHQFVTRNLIVRGYHGKNLKWLGMRLHTNSTQIWLMWAQISVWRCALLRDVMWHKSVWKSSYIVYHVLSHLFSCSSMIIYYYTGHYCDVLICLVCIKLSH